MRTPYITRHKSQALESARKNGGNKYGAIATRVDNIRFDSKLEAKRYGELKLLAKAGKIMGLEVHPRFRLNIADTHICYYEADFKYFDTETGKQMVEDCKSSVTVTDLYRIKKKMMKATYNIDVVEVFA